MTDIKYVLADDGEKYPVGSLDTSAAEQAIPGCSCGISLIKDVDKSEQVDSKTIIDAINKAEQFDFRESTNAAFNIDACANVDVDYNSVDCDLEELLRAKVHENINCEEPKEPEINFPQTSILHRLFYPVYEFLIYTEVTGILLLNLVFALLFIFTPAVLLPKIYNIPMLYYAIVTSLIVLVDLFFVFTVLEMYNVQSYIAHNYVAVLHGSIPVRTVERCHIVRVVLPDTNFEDTVFCVEDTDGKQFNCYGRDILCDLITVSDPVVLDYQNYLYALKEYVYNYNTEIVSMYYPDFDKDKTFISFAKQNAETDDIGRFVNVNALIRTYAEQLKQIKQQKQAVQQDVNSVRQVLVNAQN